MTENERALGFYEWTFRDGSRCQTCLKILPFPDGGGNRKFCDVECCEAYPKRGEWAKAETARRIAEARAIVVETLTHA